MDGQNNTNYLYCSSHIGLIVETSTSTTYFSVERESSYQWRCNLRSYSNHIQAIKGSASVNKEPKYLYGGQV